MKNTIITSALALSLASISLTQADLGTYDTTKRVALSAAVGIGAVGLHLFLQSRFNDRSTDIALDDLEAILPVKQGEPLIPAKQCLVGYFKVKKPSLVGFARIAAAKVIEENKGNPSFANTSPEQVRSTIDNNGSWFKPHMYKAIYRHRAQKEFAHTMIMPVTLGAGALSLIWKNKLFKQS